MLHTCGLVIERDGLSFPQYQNLTHFTSRKLHLVNGGQYSCLLKISGRQSPFKQSQQGILKLSHRGQDVVTGCGNLEGADCSLINGSGTDRCHCSGTAPPMETAEAFVLAQGISRNLLGKISLISV